MEPIIKHTNFTLADHWLGFRGTNLFFYFINCKGRVTTLAQLANYYGHVSPSPSCQLSLHKRNRRTGGKLTTFNKALTVSNEIDLS